jgi:hypothetical protein
VGGIVRRIIVAVVAFAVVSLGGLAWKYLTGAPSTANVGDCMAGQSKNDIRTVNCANPAATRKVVARLEGKTEADFNATTDPCTVYPAADVAVWEGKSGAKGYILCLEPIKK